MKRANLYWIVISPVFFFAFVYMGLALVFNSISERHHSPQNRNLRVLKQRRNEPSDTLKIMPGSPTLTQTSFDYTYDPENDSSSQFKPEANLFMEFQD